MVYDWQPGGADSLVEALQNDYIASIASYDVQGLLSDRRMGRGAIVSSFGAESAVLLHYVSEVLPDIPVLFIDTHKHFPETLEYRRILAERLRLNVIDVRPDAAQVAADDPTGDLHGRSPNECCMIRKVFPLQDQLDGYDFWISGRKRFQSSQRAAVPILERDGKKLKVNPLALWSKDDVDSYFRRHDLPRHPLESRGFLSIGCAPCTRAVQSGEDPRAGRWADTPEKSECGIHLGPDGRFVRTAKPD